MKKYVRSSTDGTADEYMSKIIIVFNRSAKRNFPEVEVELNSYRLDRESKTLEWFGDMEYQNVNLPLHIKIDGDIDSVSSFDEFGKTYFGDIVNQYLRIVESKYGDLDTIVN